MLENLPRGLREVLEVYRFVRLSGYDRVSAVKEVALRHRVDPQTVSSACTRSLGILTADFEELLQPRNASRFRDHLVRRFPGFRDDIVAFFSHLQGVAAQGGERPEFDIREILLPDERRLLQVSLQLDHIKKKLAAWADRSDIPEEIRREMRELTLPIDAG